MSNPGTFSSGSSSRDAELDALFNNMPVEASVTADLPSKGKFYKTSLINVKPLVFEDEQKILQSKGKNLNIMNEIIAKCIEGVTLDELLLFDKLYLLLKIKEISYGSEYKFEAVCPNCGGTTTTNIDISKLSVNYLDMDTTDPREVELPMLKVKALVKFPRVRDEIFLKDVDTALANMYRFVVSINGNEDPVFIAKAMKRMHIRDMKTLVKEINRNDLGTDPRFQFSCPHCSQHSLMEVPLDANFFSVT